jgi:hypothetical protein
MTNWNTTLTRPAAGRAAIAALAMAVTIGAPRLAAAQTVTPPAVPAAIEVPAPSQAYLLGHAFGTQNYVCVATSDIGHVAWTLFTPQATLFTPTGGQLTTHFFGPNPAEGSIVRAAWQDSADTSTVWARAKASSTDPNFVAPGAVAWVLLETVGTRTGPTGGDTLSATTFIQRLNTVGGVAPSTGCSKPTDIGNKAFQPYEADYFFFRQ